MNPLIALAKRELLEQFTLEEWIWSDPETAAYFKGLTPPPPITPKPAPKVMPTLPPAPRPVLAPQKKIEPAAPPISKTPLPRAQETKERIRKDFRELRSLLQEKVNIIEDVPSDEQAKRIANGWKDPYPKVAIVAIHATKDQLDMLEKIAKAIEGIGHESKVLIGEQDWEKLFQAPKLKLLLVPEETLQTHAAFKDLKVAVRPLLPISTYLQKPEEKMKLWKQIKDDLL